MNESIAIVRRKVKRLRIELVPPDWRVEVIAPEGMSDEAVQRYISFNLPAIRRNQKNRMEHSHVSGKRIPQREYRSGESHWHWGGRKLLSVQDSGDLLPGVCAGYKEIILSVPKGSTCEFKARVMQDFYRAEMLIWGEKEIAYWQQLTGAHIKAWHIKPLRSSWVRQTGGVVTLNLWLATIFEMAARYAVGSVIAPMVGKQVESFVPNWRVAKSELNNAVLVDMMHKEGV